MGHTVINCPEDADTKVAAAAIDNTAADTPVTVIADDTDILCLLIYHFKEHMADIYFSSEKACKTWSIRDIVKHIGPILKHHILFLHAWLCCDTTSAIFEHGKTSLSKKLQSSEKLQALSDQISDPSVTEDDVIDAGHQIFMLLYGGEASGSLTKLR